MEDFDYSQLPEPIQEMASAVRKFENSRMGRNGNVDVRIAKFRLKIALWVCSHEHLEPNLENLVAILGPNFRSSAPYFEDVKKELGIK